jgi:signal-transduction protein with cAMP-binding, CBS, and nucleotidyltransferase domain
MVSIKCDVKKTSVVLFLRSSSAERTVGRLKLSKALTIPEGTTVLDACRRMAARRVDAALLTDASALLSGILTDKVLLISVELVFVSMTA